MTHSRLEQLAHIHQHRLDKGRSVLNEGARGLEDLQRRRQDATTTLEDLDALLKESEELMVNLGELSSQERATLEHAAGDLCSLAHLPPLRSGPRFEPLDILEVDEHDSLEVLWQRHASYAERNSLDIQASLAAMLPREDLERLRNRIDEDFTYKNAHCDGYDYMIAGTVGILGGLVDIFLVGAPSEGVLGRWADVTTDKTVEGFARLCGWKGPRDSNNPTKSAIGFLEGKFRINYDHRYGPDVNNTFSMSTRNHHIKSLAHSPDLVGLFFSILDQFTNTAHFVHQGKLIAISTDNFELSGSNIITKCFAGFINWLGHLFSDAAGSSGTQARGSGIPIPFFSLLQFINVGSFGQYRQSFSTVCVQVFEKGYDLRHGMALAAPVMITELLVRVMFMLKRHHSHDEALAMKTAFSSAPELRRMLLVAHGALCLMDAGDAALRSGGNMVTFLLRTNLIGWVRFGMLSMQELNALLKHGHINAARMDSYLNTEYQRLLADPASV